MPRKLTLVALAASAGAAAYFLSTRDNQGQPAADTSGFAPGPDVAAQTADTVESPALDMGGDGLADLRSDQPSHASTGEGAVPDTSAADPLVREQEAAAAAAAGSIGGQADTVTAEADPAMRPVVEGSGDAEETFEQTEDQGR